MRRGSEDALGRLKGVAEAVDGGNRVVSCEAQIGPFQSDLRDDGMTQKRRVEQATTRSAEVPLQPVEKDVLESPAGPGLADARTSCKRR